MSDNVTRVERLLEAILDGDADVGVDPVTRTERLLYDIAKKGGGGPGLPSGGVAGQVLAKKTDADNDVEWKPPGIAPGVEYTTTAPTAANTDGLKFVVLTAEPSDYYDGWVYIITEA